MTVEEFVAAMFAGVDVPDLHDETGRLRRVSRYELLELIHELADQIFQTNGKILTCISQALEMLDHGNTGIETVHDNLMAMRKEVREYLKAILHEVRETQDRVSVAMVFSGIASLLSVATIGVVLFRRTPADRVLNDINILNENLHTVASQNNRIYDSINRVDRTVRAHDVRLQNSIGKMLEMPIQFNPTPEMMN